MHTRKYLSLDLYVTGGGELNETALFNWKTVTVSCSSFLHGHVTKDSHPNLSFRSQSPMLLQIKSIFTTAIMNLWNCQTYLQYV